jgi:uncharacterized membrane protein
MGGPFTETAGDLPMTVSEAHASDASRTLAYECPHCGAANTVDPAAIGEIVTCLNDDCGQVFKIDAPAGHLLRDDDPKVVEARANHQEDTVSQTERNLFTVHPAIFGNQPLSFLGVLLLVIGGIVGAVMARNELILMYSGSALAAAGAMVIAYWWLQTRFRSVSVTSKRTLYTQGIFSKQTSEVQHDDVRNMQVHQSFFDRLVGVGHLAISSSGQDDMEIDVRGLKSPQRVIDIIREYQ